MSRNWTRKGPGAPWLLEAAHGVWAVSELRPGGRAELRYGAFDAAGRLPVAPLAIGEFAAAVEARFAAEAYEADEPPELPEDLAQGFGPEGGEAGILAPDGRAFRLALSAGAVTLQVEAEGALTEWARLDRPRPGGDGPGYARPPGHEDPAALDLAIMLALAEQAGGAAP